MLTQRHAQEIADKLSASISPGTRHDLVVVRCEDKVVGSYGIQRGSKESEHNYIPKQIGVTARQAQDLANCPMSKEEYWALMKKKASSSQ